LLLVIAGVIPYCESRFVKIVQSVSAFVLLDIRTKKRMKKIAVILILILSPL